MRPKTLLVLAALVAVLVAFVWFIERDLPSSQERVAQARKVVDLEPDAVERVVIARPEGVIELVRDPAPAPANEEGAGQDGPRWGAWRLIQPLEASADAAAVDSLVSRLVELEKKRTLEQVTRDDVGLSEPRAKVTLASGGDETVLEIGAAIPASRNMTLAVEGLEEVYVVSNSIWSDLAKPAGEWRDKRLFMGNRSDIEQVILHRGTERVLLVRRGSVYWVESPLVDRANEADVNALLSLISALRAERFIEETEAAGLEMGLDPPEGSIEVRLADRETTLRIELGAIESEIGNPTRFARVDSHLVTLVGELATHLERSATDWRSRKWATSQVFEIERAVITDGAGEIEIRRHNGDWLRDGERLEYGPATDLLYELTGAEAERLERAGALTLGAPEVTVRLEGTQDMSEVLMLYAPQGESVPARSSGRESTLLLLPPSVAQRVVEKIAALRAAELAPDDEAEPEDAPGDGP